MSCINCGKSAGCIDCGYCTKKALFCSEKCQMLGWSVHQDDCNVVTVDSSAMSAFLPIGAGLHVLKSYNVKGIVEQRVIDNEIEPTVADNLASEYDMDIQLSNGKGVTLEQLEHAIHADASGIAGRLSLARNHGGTSYWSGPLNLEAPVAGTVTVQVRNSATGETLSSIEGVYDLMDAQEAQGRNLTPEQKEFRIKNPNNFSTIVKSFRGIDASGNNAVQLTFDSKTNKLIDVEVQAIEPVDELVSESYPFRCDPKDIDHVSGLLMAMATSGMNFGDRFDIINDHYKDLEAGRGTDPSPKVNSAVHAATKMLWEEIGGQAQQRKYVDKLTRGGSQQAVALAYGLYMKMHGARGKSGVKKPLGWAQKKIYRRQLTDLQAAINQMLANPDVDTNNGWYVAALNIIKAALNPNNPQLDDATKQVLIDLGFFQ